MNLVYYEAYLDKQDALDRENKLKHHGSVIGHLKKRLTKELSYLNSAKRAGLNSQTPLPFGGEFDLFLGFKIGTLTKREGL